MITQIKKWGNSLAIRIPKSFAKEVEIKEGSRVDISIDEKKIVIEPAVKPEKYELKDLLAEVKESNIHKEYLKDSPCGKEIW